VVSGFEPLDLLQGIVMILAQLQRGEAIVENQYKRVVPWEGNRAALRAINEVFELRPYFEWRGMGFISQSALKLRDSYAEWDSERRFAVPGLRVTDPEGRAVRRGAQGRPETGAVQTLRQGMHAGKSGGSADGFVGRIMRGVFQLRASEDAGDHHRRVGVSGETPIEGANRKIRFREPQIEMAHGAGGKASRRLVEGLFAPLLFESSGHASGRRGPHRYQWHCAGADHR
jgi:hypothetical protein